MNLERAQFALGKISPLLAVWTLLGVGIVLTGASTFSQISPALTPPAATDQVLGVQSGANDVLWTLQQLSATPPNTQSGTTYTLALTDAAGIVEMSNSSANTVTIPANGSVAFIVGSRVTLVQTGTGATTVAPGSGVTLLGATASTATQYAGITIYQRAVNTWVVLQ